MPHLTPMRIRLHADRTGFLRRSSERRVGRTRQGTAQAQDGNRRPGSTSMFNLSEAAELARRATGCEVDVDRAQETVAGWFFPYSDMRFGSNGVVINKTTGRALVLGSGFTVARDLALYDKGYQ